MFLGVEKKFYHKNIAIFILPRHKKLVLIFPLPSGQNRQPKKQSEGVRFGNSALKMQCHIVKNTLLHVI